VADRPAKSIGHEETFARDERDGRALQRHAVRMSESVAEQLRKSELTARTVSIKVRFADFTTITRSHTLTTGVDTPAAIAAVAGALLDGVDPSPGVRLFGVSMSSLQPRTDEPHQMAFNLGAVPPAGDAAPAGGEAPENAGARAARLQSGWGEITAAVDAIRARYGRSSVGSAAMVGDSGLHVPTRREAPWGPAADTDAAAKRISETPPDQPPEPPG
jgi:DNA polymerase-4